LIDSSAKGSLVKRGPAWLGIGAQRSGTTWLTDLLCQHPQVDVPANGWKEQHRLYRGLLTPWSPSHTRRYRRLFAHPDPRMRIGECTPFYLRAPWAADVAALTVHEDTPVWAILRDPVHRFESAIRYWITLRQGNKDRKQGYGARWLRIHSDQALWGGMYATQLDAWASVLGRERIRVLQYEQVRADPQPHVDGLWKAMGLDPVPLVSAESESRMSSDKAVWSMDSIEGLREHVTRMYRAESQRLEPWGIDTSLWA
jgi:hypothetical protein